MLLNVAINVTQITTARSLQLRDLKLDIFSKILYLRLITQLRVSKYWAIIEEEWAKNAFHFMPHLLKVTTSRYFITFASLGKSEP